MVVVVNKLKGFIFKNELSLNRKANVEDISNIEDFKESQKAATKKHC